MSTTKQQTWETLGVAPPRTVQEAQSRIADLKASLVFLTTKMRPPAADASAEKWRKFRLLDAEFQAKASERRMLGVWIQQWQIQEREVRLANRAEEGTPKKESVTPHIPPPLPNDFVELGNNLHELGRAWTRFMTIVGNAVAFVDAENAGDELAADKAYAALEAAIAFARSKGCIMPEPSSTAEDSS